MELVFGLYPLETGDKCTDTYIYLYEFSMKTGWVTNWVVLWVFYTWYIRAGSLYILQFTFLRSLARLCLRFVFSFILLLLLPLLLWRVLAKFFKLSSVFEIVIHASLNLIYYTIKTPVVTEGCANDFLFFVYLFSCCCSNMLLAWFHRSWNTKRERYQLPAIFLSKSIKIKC